MPHLLASSARPVAYTALAFAAAVAGVLVATPRTSEAVGGLSLTDRMLLSGTPRTYHVQGCNDPNAPTVPEGRRLYIFEFRSQPVGSGRRVRLGSWEVTSGNPEQWTVSNRFNPPIVIEAGQPIRLDCWVNDGRLSAGNPYLNITQAYEF